MTLEELLNKLIEKGWKPFGYYDRMYLSDKSCYQYHKGEGIKSYFFVKGNGVGDNFTLRELTSKESLLRQFVCENGMVRKKMCYCIIRTDIYEFHDYYDYNYEYRLIESALCDEDKLEQFLLDNIKIDEKDNM